VAGIVVALALGAALAALWFRARSATAAAQEAADTTRPIADTLARIETHIRDIESQRQHMMGGIEQQLGALSKETVALSQALRVPNARGRWGELTLRRVAELAGMVPYCDFYEQESGAAQRPDMLVRLPSGRTLAVDAKVPLAAYLDAEAATDAPARDAALARHPTLILIDELAHTNAPGSRHTKRWQDVEELLAAGIHVYTTINVQHLESLNDVVAQITGIRVRETVPDSALERADDV